VSLAIQTVAVVGAGTMGHGIAQVAAQAGWSVRLTDAVPGAAAQALERIRGNLRGAVERGKLKWEAAEEALASILPCDELGGAVADADLCIEAVPEQLELKQELFRSIERLAQPRAMLASNTSSLSITAIAGALEGPQRLLGMHFFNPVHIMRLVEVVTHPRLDGRYLEAALAAARAMGKEPIVVKDSPGFASSRLGLALGLEAMRMLEDEVASAEDIDRAMTLGYGHPMGPLRLTDLVGLDVRLAVSEHLERTLGAARFRPPEILRRLVAQGKLGKKAGQGFYAWKDA
jgi:3-hydroxybutyryl-CoA dehydrogenase